MKVTARRRRVHVAVATGLICAAAFAASCGGGESGSSRELTFFIFNEPSGAYQKAADACTKDSNGRYSITFEFLPAQADAQREQLVRRLGAEDSSIDIIGMDVIWTAEFANAGWVQEWTGARKAQVTRNVFRSVIDGASFEGKLYTAPFTSNTQLLWYRKDRVRTAPETWEEMLAQARRIGAQGKIQVQANRYEGFTVWATAMIESAGAQILRGPTEVGLAERPTERALSVMGQYARSPAAPTDIDTSTEDSSRLSFEAGDSSFMLNYPFVYPSAKENAPDVFKNLGAAVYPRVDPNRESRPPLGGINLGVSTFSENQDLAFEAITCLVKPENQVIAATDGGLPPVREDIYATEGVRKAYPGFAQLIKESIENSAPRPQTPAYQDVSLAIQRALHPVAKIDPADPKSTYEELKSKVEDAVKREGLL